MAATPSPPPTITDEARARAPIRSEIVVGMSVLYVVLATMFTGTRLYTRFAVYKQLWWDDWATLVAWMGTIALCTLFIMMQQHGGGLHHADVPNTEYARYVALFQDVQMVARSSMFFAKLAILLLYVRLFFPPGVPRGRAPLWRVLQAVVALNALYTAGLILAIALQCVQRHHPAKPYGASCVNQYAVLLSASVINIVSDLLVLLIPMWSLWRLNMGRRRKWAVWALFAFGTLAPLSSIARLAYQIPMAGGTDTTVIYMVVILLALAEQVIAIVAGCAPVVSAWFVRLVRGGMHRGPAAINANVPRTTTTARRLREWGRAGKASDPHPTAVTTAGPGQGLGLSTAGSAEALAPMATRGRVGPVEDDYDDDAQSARSRSERWELRDVATIAAQAGKEAREGPVV